MKNQLLELFGDMAFKFEFRCDNITEYVSVFPTFMDGDFCYIKVYFFDDSSNYLFAYETFEDLSKRYKLFKIEKLTAFENNQKEVLFHQNLDEDEFY